MVSSFTKRYRKFLIHWVEVSGWWAGCQTQLEGSLEESQVPEREEEGLEGGQGGGRYRRSRARQAGMPAEAIFDSGPRVLRAVEVVERIRRPGDVILIKGRDTQRLDRVALGLMGRRVGCTVRFCDLKFGPCDRCSYLLRGWPENIVRM